MKSSLSEPRRALQWAPKFTRKLAKSCLGGEAYAFSETADRVVCSREFFSPLEGISPGMAGMEVCESLPARLKGEKMAIEEYLARHLPRYQTGFRKW